MIISAYDLENVIKEKYKDLYNEYKNRIKYLNIIQYILNCVSGKNIIYKLDEINDKNDVIIKRITTNGDDYNIYATKSSLEDDIKFECYDNAVVDKTEIFVLNRLKPLFSKYFDSKNKFNSIKNKFKINEYTFDYNNSKLNIYVTKNGEVNSNLIVTEDNKTYWYNNTENQIYDLLKTFKINTDNIDDLYIKNYIENNFNDEKDKIFKLLKRK